jgi:hypothetical protein
MSTTLLNELQRQRLRDLSRVCKDGNYPTLPNLPLDKYLEELRDQYPEAFHTRESLKNRVFMDEPRFPPGAKFVRRYGESPIHSRTATS